jgi:hypothetical protein
MEVYGSLDVTGSVDAQKVARPLELAVMASVL